jgi:hypothetical protein
MGVKLDQLEESVATALEINENERARLLTLRSLRRQIEEALSREPLIPWEKEDSRSK